MSQFTRASMIGIIIGIYNLHNVFEESYYKDVYGGILEAFGILFGRNVKFYVYPSFKRAQPDVIYRLKDFVVTEKLRPLLEYLITNNKVAPMLDANLENLSIISDNVLDLIRDNAEGWENYVPNKVAEAIKTYQMFDFSGNNEKNKSRTKTKTKTKAKAKKKLVK